MQIINTVPVYAMDRVTARRGERDYHGSALVAADSWSTREQLTFSLAFASDLH